MGKVHCLFFPLYILFNSVSQYSLTHALSCSLTHSTRHKVSYKTGEGLFPTSPSVFLSQFYFSLPDSSLYTVKLPWPPLLQLVSYSFSFLVIGTNTILFYFMPQYTVSKLLNMHIYISDEEEMGTLDVTQMVWIDIKCTGLMQRDSSEVRAVRQQKKK